MQGLIVEKLPIYNCMLDFMEILYENNIGDGLFPDDRIWFQTGTGS